MPTLKQDEVHLWRIRLDSTAREMEMFTGTLSEDERKRALRYRFRKDCKQYVICRAAVRLLLAHYTGLDACDIRFSYSPRGKPSLGSLTGRVLFNVSHSHELALFAVSGNGEVGVDLEFARQDIPFLAIAEHFFPQSEYRELHALQEDRRREAFFRKWVCKEALAKCADRDLAEFLKGTEITLLAPNMAVELSPEAESGSIWFLQEVGLAKDYVAAVATNAAAVQFKYWEWIPPGGFRSEEETARAE